MVRRLSDVTTLMTEIETWHPSQSSLAIEYTRAVMDAVRDQVIAGFRRLSRGGVEVGGILYGLREEGKVRIQATVPVSCEYKSGPSFVLSDKDKLRLLEQLTNSETTDDLKGLVVVGWYVSHPRGSIALTDGDLDIFNEFFPAIWNVALVLKPGDQAVRCGFFVREPRGALNIAQSYQEFEIALPRSVEGSSAVRQIADQVASSLAAQREPAPDPSDSRRRGRREIMEMPSAPRPANSPRAGSHGAAAAAAMAPGSEEASLPNWSTAVARPRSAIVALRRAEHTRRLQWRWIVLWVMAMALVVGGTYAYHEFTAAVPLGLRVAEHDGDLMIQWDPAARPLRWAETGRIMIQSADQGVTKIDLSQRELAAGKYLYEGTEGDTSIHLSVDGRLGYHAEESTRYVAQVAPVEPGASGGGKPQADIRNPKKLQAEVRRLRDELEKSQRRVKELELLLYNR